MDNGCSDRHPDVRVKGALRGAGDVLRDGCGRKRSRVKTRTGSRRSLSERPESERQADPLRVSTAKSSLSRCEGQKTERRLTGSWLGFGMERGHGEPTLRVKMARHGRLSLLDAGRGSTFAACEFQREKIASCIQCVDILRLK